MPYDFILETLNKEMYIDIFLRLWDAVRKKIPKNGELVIVFIVHDNFPAHRSVFVRDS